MACPWSQCDSHWDTTADRQTQGRSWIARTVDSRSLINSRIATKASRRTRSSSRGATISGHGTWRNRRSATTSVRRTRSSTRSVMTVDRRTRISCRSGRQQGFQKWVRRQEAGEGISMYSGKSVFCLHEKPEGSFSTVLKARRAAWVATRSTHDSYSALCHGHGMRQRRWRVE